MNFLVIGDVVGESGLIKLTETIPDLIKENNIDFVIVNGENSANGKGLRHREYEIIKKAGADAITMGNHVYYRKEMKDEYIKYNDLVLPANITNLEKNGYVIIEKNNKKIGVVNLIGKFGFPDPGNVIDSPFKVIDEILVKLKTCDYIFVDFHAEATAEKIAMGYYLEGKVTCVFGTHTHVQTADETILKNSTAYITDVGMTGPKDSVIGLDRDVALARFIKNEKNRYLCSNNIAFLNGIIVKVNDNISISRVNR